MSGMMVPPADEDNLASEQWQELADGFNELQTNLFQGAFKKQVPWKVDPYTPPEPKVVKPEPEPGAEAEKTEEPAAAAEPAAKAANPAPAPAKAPAPKPVEAKEAPKE